MALKVNADKIQSKGIKSIRSRVAKLRGARYEEFAIRERLAGIELRRYFGALDPKAFVALLLFT
ncbi:hypothetical protein ICC18_09930 [Paenibacillus sp. WST5]|uniref:lipoate--protein ligase n=1 Tax=Paenibacillus sedimenti TaxID=2770274 RepID=A0A926KNL7_9BACL|nr:hypothetical protein [Paenibacillus sedimenti]